MWQAYQDRKINIKRRKGEEGYEKTEGIRNNIEVTTVRKIKETTERHSEEDSNKPVRWCPRITYNLHLQSWTSKPCFSKQSTLSLQSAFDSFLLTIPFEPEDEGDMFLWNVKLSLKSTALQPRRPLFYFNFSLLTVFMSPWLIVEYASSEMHG
jgi:hypothetical protein